VLEVEVQPKLCGVTGLSVAQVVHDEPCHGDSHWTNAARMDTGRNVIGRDGVGQSIELTLHLAADS
jgi:hypothetical protein